MEAFSHTGNYLLEVPLLCSIDMCSVKVCDVVFCNLCSPYQGALTRHRAPGANDGMEAVGRTDCQRCGIGAEILTQWQGSCGHNICPACANHQTADRGCLCIDCDPASAHLQNACSDDAEQSVQDEDSQDRDLGTQCLRYFEDSDKLVRCQGPCGQPTCPQCVGHHADDCGGGVALTVVYPVTRSPSGAEKLTTGAQWAVHVAPRCSPTAVKCVRPVAEPTPQQAMYNGASRPATLRFWRGVLQ